MMLGYRRGEATGSGVMYLFVFFLMIILIITGIYGSLIAFFGKGYDYRKTEAQSLLSEVRNCMDKKKLDAASLTEEIFFDSCPISANVIKDGNHLIYIKSKSGKEFAVGVADFKIRCGLVSRYKNKDYPLCASHNNANYEVLVGSSQNARRIAA